MRSALRTLVHRPAVGGRFILSAALMISAFNSAAWCQTVVVQIMNGRSGKPAPKVRVYIGFDDLKSRQSLDLTTNRQGVIQFETDGAKTFQVHPVGEVACGEQPVGAPSRDYSIEDILKAGILTQNNCGHSTAEARRGRLVYFVRPATGWELFKN
jgi:hypothetical protein